MSAKTLQPILGGRTRNEVLIQWKNEIDHGLNLSRKKVDKMTLEQVRRRIRRNFSQLSGTGR